jgi:hypothetical protein
MKNDMQVTISFCLLLLFVFVAESVAKNTCAPDSPHKHPISVCISFMKRATQHTHAHHTTRTRITPRTHPHATPARHPDHPGDHQYAMRSIHSHDKP